MSSLWEKVLTELRAPSCMENPLEKVSRIELSHQPLPTNISCSFCSELLPEAFNESGKQLPNPSNPASTFDEELPDTSEGEMHC